MLGKKISKEQAKEKKAFKEFSQAASVFLFFTATVWNLGGRAPVVLLQFPCFLSGHKPLKSLICIHSAQSPQNLAAKLAKASSEDAIGNGKLQPRAEGDEPDFFVLQLILPDAAGDCGIRHRNWLCQHYVLGSKCRQNKGRRKTKSILKETERITSSREQREES